MRRMERPVSSEGEDRGVRSRVSHRMALVLVLAGMAAVVSGIAVFAATPALASSCDAGTVTITWDGGAGTSTIASGATFSIDPSAGNNVLDNTRVLAIASGATGTVTSDGTWFGFGGTVTNAGVLTVTGNSAIGPPITNTGTLNKTSTG